MLSPLIELLLDLLNLLQQLHFGLFLFSDAFRDPLSKSIPVGAVN